MHDAGRRPVGRLCCWVLAVIAAFGSGLPLAAVPDPQSGPPTTTVADTVYQADGTLAQGTLIISWPAFVTAGGAAVAAGNTSVTLATNGTFSVALVPNAGATPAGVYYTVVYQIGPGEVKTEYWVVPTTSPANLATVRTTPGSGQAQAPVSMQYVNSALVTKANDNAVVHLAGTETISGAKTFSTAPNVPAPVNSGDVANKAYVDSSVANVGAGNYLPTAGGTMTGPITLPANPAAPMQASTKQYVDTGLAAKADLVSGLVPASELGTGSATAGSCLVGNGASGTWGACGGGSGAGNLSTTPVASQNIAQPAGTQFSSNNFGNIRYVTASWNWAQTPADNLGTAGNHTIHFSPCPLGLDTSNNTHAPYAVYIWGTGTPEAVTVTGGSCPAGTASGTITVTTANGHGPGYAVGSASTGIQEAINDASSTSGTPFTNVQLLPAGSATPNYTVYATVFLRANRTKLSGYGAHILCYTRQVCIFDADEVGGGSAGAAGSFNTIEGIEFQPGLNVDGVQIASVSAASGVYTVTTASSHPFVTGDYVTLFYSTPAATQEARVQITVTAANQFQYTIGSSATFASSSGYGWAALENAAIEDYGDHVTFRDIKIESPGGGFFSWGIVIDNDQSAKIDGLTNEGNAAVKCSTANFCGAMVYARGDSGIAPVLEIDHLEASMQCGGNGVRYVPGNALSIQNSVVQGFNQYGIYYGGGLQPLTVSTTYQESSPGCYNLSYPGTIASQVGILSNSDVDVQSDDPVGGAFPAFVAANPGAQQNNYYVAIHSSTLGYMGMYYVGGCATTGVGNCTVYWPEPDIDGLGTVTYDVLVTVGLSAVPPNGTGSYAVATGISGSCTTAGICTFTDPQTGTSSYTVGTISHSPKLNFWPAAIALGAGARLTIDKCGQSWDILTTITQPAVFCNQGIVSGNSSQHSPFFAVFATGDSVGANNASVGATLKVSGPSAGPASSAQKGLLNFINFGQLGQTDVLTLADCNPLLTLATGGYRPAWSPCDTALGFDSPSNTVQSSAGLFVRAPASISQYINVLPTGSNWLERLTAASKTFNVGVAINGNLAVSGGTVTLPITGTGSQCLHVSSTGVLSGTGADCGSGSGSVTVNSGATSQLAMYSGNGTAVSGDSTLTDNGTTLSYTGSGGIAAATGTFSGNLTVNGQLLVAGPWGVSSPIPGTAMAAASAGTSALGISNDGNFYISANGGTPQQVTTTATSSYFSNLFQEDANDVGEYNGTTAQNLHVYSSYTNSSTWTRTTLGYDANDGGGYAVLKSESSPSGSAPGLGFWINNGLKWVLDATGNLKPWTDQSYNIGSFSGTSGTRPGTVYVAGAATGGSGFELGKFANNSYELCNDATSGTVANGLAILTAGGCAVKPASAVTSGVIGVVIANAGTSGTATLVRTGSAYCSFDGTPTVVGDYVVPSITAYSGSYYLCHDAGPAQPTGIQVLGRVLQATAGATTAQMFFDMPGSPVGTGVFLDASQQSGTTLDAKLNAANALAITSGNGVIDARALGGAQTIASQVNIGQLLAPTVSAVTGTSPGAGTYKLVYTLTSPTATETSSSQEATITVTASQAIQMNSPTYYGTATSYNVYMTAASGTSWTEAKCAGATGVAIGTNVTITATCGGAVVSKLNSGFGVELIPPKTGAWTVTDTNGIGDCGIKFFDGSSFVGNSAGEGRSWWITDTSSANVEALVCTDNNPKNGSGYYKLVGLAAHNVSGDSVQSATMILRDFLDASVFDDEQAAASTAIPACWIYDNQGGAGTRFSGSCEANSIGEPLRVGLSGSSTRSVTLHDVSAVHPGPTFPNIELQASMDDIHFTGTTYTEGGNITGTVSTSGTAVTWASGAQFRTDGSWTNGTMFINGTSYTVSSVTSATALTLTTTAGTQTSVAYSMGCSDVVRIATTNSMFGPIIFDSLSSGANCSGTSSYLYNVPSSYTVGQLEAHSTRTGNYTNLFNYTPNTTLNISGVGTAKTYPELVMDNNSPATVVTNFQVLGATTLATATATTPATSDSSTKVATTAWVNAQGYGTGSGNVSGPASSVNADVVTFGGTNGKTIQDSGIAISSLAALASPIFTGTPQAPTQATGDNSAKIATTAYVKNEVQLAWTCPVAGATTTGVSYCNWTVPANITITQFDLALSTAPAGCTTYPTLQVWDGKANVEVGSYSITTTSSGGNFYPVVTGSTNLAAGEYLRVKVTTGGSGCTTSPAGIVATVTYQMQN